jgi:hypothetical protein
VFEASSELLIRRVAAWAGAVTVAKAEYGDGHSDGKGEGLRRWMVLVAMRCFDEDLLAKPI